MGSKPWYTSKTLWMNALATIGIFAGAFSIDLGLDAKTQSELSLGILAVVNMALRVISSTKITAKRPPDPV